MMENNNKLGRPTIFTSELMKEICDIIASSSKGIRKLCGENADFPNPDTIYRWIRENKDFSDQYAQAKRQQIEVIVDEIMEIANDASHDLIVNENGRIIPNHANIHRSRLRIDTRKWLASKLAPKIYGDKPKEFGEEAKLTEEMMQELERIRKSYEREY